MSSELVLSQQCDKCGTENELYGSSCRHMTLCLPCGKEMALAGSPCSVCAVPVRNLIREYNVRANTGGDYSSYIGKFPSGLPPFSEKSEENKWFLHREDRQEGHLTDGSLDKHKNVPWILEDETGQYLYQGQLQGAQAANYYLLVRQGNEFIATPADSWYNFNKIPQYKQLTLEEAEEKMIKRKITATGYERWMMKAATNGPAAFGDIKMNEDASSSRLGGGRSTKGKSNVEGDNSDRNEENKEGQGTRKYKFDLNKEYVEEEEEDEKVGDFDFDNDDIEKGDDWEHEEIFTDDDEAVGNYPDEREDLDPEIPAPPEIKQDDEDEGEGYEEEGRLTKSGKELKLLLGKAAKTNESDADENNDDNVDVMVNEIGTSPVLAPKEKDVAKEEPAYSSPVKTTPPGSAQGTPSPSKSSIAKRKPGSDDSKSAKGAPAKKGKAHDEKKASPVKVEASSSSKTSVPSKIASSESAKAGSAPSASPVSEEEIRNAILEMTPVTTQDLVAKFKPRLASVEDKSAFTKILKATAKLQNVNGQNYVVLAEK